MKRIGIYGGTFDPIHHGHLILAQEALEQLMLEEIIFVPAAASPHKLDQPLTPPAIRAQMLEAALSGMRCFSIDRCELNRPPPSFAFDTVEDIRQRDPQTEFYYLVGADNLPGLRSWHRIDALEKIVQFVVLERTGMLRESQFPTIQRHIDISATEIRNRVAGGRSIRYLVPDAVEHIIARERLYQDPQRLPKKL
ncbi:MAG: nicotinate (nicotinamide) nucleotide adenylyltransferase [Chthoniobacterales bacterium]|nr:nicotinate (nicotinamide) nucleotide adenylyltransferase [Chthoniobacterales bacterium]